jgi:hypothetical protein
MIIDDGGAVALAGYSRIGVACPRVNDSAIILSS